MKREEQAKLVEDEILRVARIIWARRGGQKKSERKTEACRKNIRKRWAMYRAKKAAEQVTP